MVQRSNLPRTTSCLAVSLLLVSSVTMSVAGQDAHADSAVNQLAAFLSGDAVDWAAIGSQDFATLPLSKEESTKATTLLLDVRRQMLLEERSAEMKAAKITLGDKTMPFSFKTFGDQPKGERSLFISMHGGGGAPKRVNDSQWKNQKRLYEPKQGVYVAPRAPTDTWNLWHQQHIMPMFDRLIENMILFEGVAPNRVYLMGYSAGGDGVYQLGPRMADRWAAAAMMAGHPNDAQPLNLRNIGFALYMGGKDRAYKRNQVAAEWGEKLKKLQQEDPKGYRHLVTIYPDKGHWMDGEDASSLAWLSKLFRNTTPKKIVWRKDGNPQPRFYWLGANVAAWESGETIEAERQGQQISLSKKPPGLRLLLNDELFDLDEELTIRVDDSTQAVHAKRTISSIHQSLTERFDPEFIYSAIVECN